VHAKATNPKRSNKVAKAKVPCGPVTQVAKFVPKLPKPVKPVVEEPLCDVNDVVYAASEYTLTSKQPLINSDSPLTHILIPHLLH